MKKLTGRPKSRFHWVAECKDCAQDKTILCNMVGDEGFSDIKCDKCQILISPNTNYYVALLPIEPA